MKIANNVIGNILGKPRKRGGRNDYDGDGVPNKKDCQPRNTMRQDTVAIEVNWDSEKSIKTAEMKKSKLENTGYRLIDTISGANSATMYYRK